MHAVVITEPGGPEVLRWLEVPDPVPGPGEVVIDIAASGVNRADLMQRQGLYPPPPGAPPYPGLECSGRIRAVGAGVTGWRSVTRCARCWPAAATPSRSRCPPGRCCRCPRGWTWSTAAALPEIACTVYSNVFQLARLTAGETLLVHGGGSGIGTIAIQLGKAFGARVACTAGSARKAGPLPRARRRRGRSTTGTRTSSRPCSTPPAARAPT